MLGNPQFLNAHSFFSDSVSAFPPALRMCVWYEKISPLITKGFAMLRNLCARMFGMKKYLTTLLVAALPIIHAQAADLENRLPGYWQPDMTKTLALAKRENRRIDPMTEAMMGKMIFEFQKDEMIIHGPPGMKSDAPPVPYASKRVDKAAFTLIAGGKEMMVRFHEGQMALYAPENGWIIFNRISKEDFAKRQAGNNAAVDEVPTTGKLEDASAQPISAKPAAGKVRGKEFKVEKAILKQGNGILELRQGEDFFADMQFTIFTFRKDGDTIDGKHFTVKPTQTSGTPHIHMAYKVEGKRLPETEIHTDKYTMSLEFGAVKDGKIPGKINLRLPDEAESFVVGSFEAEIR